MGFAYLFDLDDEEEEFDDNIIDVNCMNFSLIKMYAPDFYNTLNMMYILNMMMIIKICL